MIIGLTGKRLSGKDTVGAYLVANYDFQRIAFADKLKDMVATLFGITREDVDNFKGDRNESIPTVEVNLDIGGTVTYTYGWVEFLQRFGTEMGRGIGGLDFWVNLALPIETWREFIQIYPNTKLVITDVRFDNEAKRVKDLGGTIFKLVRSIDDPYTNHESEFGIDGKFVDYEIDNNRTLAELYSTLDKNMEVLGYERIS